jgi:hypothetical protein
MISTGFKQLFTIVIITPTPRYITEKNISCTSCMYLEECSIPSQLIVIICTSYKHEPTYLQTEMK